MTAVSVALWAWRLGRGLRVATAWRCPAVWRVAAVRVAPRIRPASRGVHKCRVLCGEGGGLRGRLLDEWRWFVGCLMGVDVGVWRCGVVRVMVVGLVVFWISVVQKDTGL